MENTQIILQNNIKKICIHIQDGAKKSKLKKKFHPDKFIIESLVSVNGQSTEKIYYKHGFLGRGGFANCYVTQCLGNPKLMATKIIKKSDLKSNRTKMRLMNEIKNHKTFKHENIVGFQHYFEDYENVYLMLELCENESLNQLLKSRQFISTPEIQSFLYGICNGVSYLHSKKYIHRDLKLANIFLNDKFVVKIGDFGLTSHLEFQQQNKRTVCGTPNYIAPQILDGTGYNFSIDIWAIGIILFTLYFGFPPFESEQTHHIYYKIKKNQYNFPKNNNAPPQAINLIKKILINDPNKRPTIQQIIQSPFMKLGKGIPLTLPEICSERAPAKNDFAGIQFLKVEQETKDSTYEKKEMSIGKKMVSFVKQDEPVKKINNLISKVDKRDINEHTPNVYILELEQICENTFYFSTNCHIFGIFSKNLSIHYRHANDFIQKTSTINQIKLAHNLFMEAVKVPFNTYEYKTILNGKYRNSLSENSQPIKSEVKPVYATKVHRYKDMLMVKLSNKSIQVVYDSKDGFVYEPKQQKLYYFKNMELIRLKNHIVEIEIGSIVETVKNYVELGEKGGKALNIKTTVLTVHTNEQIKLTISKIKYIYGIMNEYKSKKTKHAPCRNSQ